mgnify:CR=1 FL=1
MNDRQRLEAIVAVVCKYLPPDGISREQAMNEIIGLIDPLPPQLEQEPVADDFFRMIADKNPKPFSSLQRTWVGLTDDEIDAIYTGVRAVHREINSDLFARAIESKLKEVNT